MDFLIIFGKIFQTLEELQEHTSFSIRVDQLTMSHMFQDQLHNTVQKLITMHHAVHAALYSIYALDRATVPGTYVPWSIGPP